MPCKARAATSSIRLVDRPQAIEPSANTAIAQRNTRRAPNLSATQPEAGMNTAKASR
ncbi:MAG: hypothetical protein ACD_54C00721G0001 [uncultured bacterium]|nr:MAG: hypothetical protein ACD_54C00721G0001 [uncultured bacterium]